MLISTHFRFLNAHQCFIFLLFSFFLIRFVSSNTPSSEDNQILQSLRPLKYSGNCAKFCKNIICQPIKECDVGVILKKESYCGCCETCVRFLNISENCIVGTLALGSQARCKHGTICVNGKCELDENDSKSCLRHKDIREKHSKSGKYESEIWIPQCDVQGFYKAKQNKISKSICVDKNGNKIFGSPDDSLKDTCACSRYIQERILKDPILFYVKPQEHCSSSGNFDTLQCIGNLCYCADMKTGQIKSELVRIDFLQNLNCFNSRIHEENYLKDCEKELQRTKKLTHEFQKKNVKINGIDKVNCDPDGTFSPTQCLPDRCICTDKRGISIREYAAELDIVYRNKMPCNCARDENAEHFQSLACETYGSYKPVTCFVDKCVCVDEDGENIALKEQENSEKDTNDASKQHLLQVCKSAMIDLLEYPSEKDDAGFTDDDYD